MTEKTSPPPAASGTPERCRLSPAAKRALAEAAERRRQRQADSGNTGHKRPPTELGGPEGPEPTRYGDWEVKGIASDF